MRLARFELAAVESALGNYSVEFPLAEVKLFPVEACALEGDADGVGLFLALAQLAKSVAEVGLGAPDVLEAGGKDAADRRQFALQRR